MSAAPPPLLAIPAEDIDTAGRLVDEALPVEWLARELADAEATVAEPGHVKLRLSRSGKADIVVRGRVQARFSVPCGRTGAPAPLDVDAELTLLLTPRPPSSPAKGKGKGKPPRRRKGREEEPVDAPAARGARPKTYEFSSSEADLDVYDGDEVVLDPFVREALLLEIPIFPLSPEALPATDPAPQEIPEPDEAPVDPRLQPLAAIRARLAEKGGGGSTQR